MNDGMNDGIWYHLQSPLHPFSPSEYKKITQQRQAQKTAQTQTEEDSEDHARNNVSVAHTIIAHRVTDSYINHISQLRTHRPITSANKAEKLKHEYKSRFNIFYESTFLKNHLLLSKSDLHREPNSNLVVPNTLLSSVLTPYSLLHRPYAKRPPYVPS